MDIVGELPVEISQKIFSYLNGRDLLNCAQVSKRWFQLVNCDIIWKRTCTSHGVREVELADDEPTCQNDGTLCKWRRIYQEQIRLINRWRMNRCKIYFLTREPSANCCSAVFENKLAFAFSNNAIELFRADANGFEPFQSIIESWPGEETIVIQMMAISKEFFSYQFANRISVYKWGKVDYEEAYRVGLNQGRLFAYDLGTTPQMDPDPWNVTENDLFTIDEGCLYMRLNHLEKVFIWDLVEKKTVGDLVIDEEAVVQYANKRLMVANGPLISVLNQRGSLCYKVLNDEPVIALWSNKNLFLSAYFEPGPVRCYSIHTGMLMYNEVKGAGEVILHPTEDIVYRLPTTEDLSVLGVEAIRLKDDVTLWMINLRDVTFLDFSSCKVVMDRFLVLFNETPFTGCLSEVCSVYCAKTGRFLYDIHDTNNQLALLTDSMMVTTGESLCVRLYKS